MLEDDGPKPRTGSHKQPFNRRITEAEQARLLWLERAGKTARLGEHAYVAKKDKP